MIPAMKVNKAWDWNKNTDNYWNEPSEESYYLFSRWKEKGFKAFLDLGCGLGRHSLQAVKSGFTVSAFDFSEEAVGRLKKQADQQGLPMDIRYGDMIELPYGDDSFDCLLAYHVISHTDTAGIRRTVSEMTRVLRTGGEFFATLCSKSAWGLRDGDYPKVDDNTFITIEEGPEKGIPHFFADENLIKDLFSDYSLIHVRHTQDLVFRDLDYNTWHYFIHGMKKSIVFP